MKKLLAISMMLFLTLGFCRLWRKESEYGEPEGVRVATHVVGDVAIVLLNSTGELKQGQNEFVVQFRDPKGQPINVGDVPAWFEHVHAEVWRRCPAIRRSHRPARLGRIA